MLDNSDLALGDPGRELPDDGNREESTVEGIAEGDKQLGEPEARSEEKAKADDADIARGVRDITAEGLEQYVTTHLSQCIVHSHMNLGVKSTRALRSGLEAFCAHYKQPGGEARFSWASACSGSDIMMRVLKRVTDHWRHAYGIGVNFDSSFCCEIDESKQEFLKLQHAPDVMFADVKDLALAKATNLINNERVMVPCAEGFAFGFSCTSRSPANARSHQNAHCIQQRRADTATSHTYEQGLKYLRRARPSLCILENIKELDQKPADDPNAVSDAQTILADLKAAGYSSVFMRLNASAYGSWTNRIRLFFVAYDGLSPANAERLKQFKVLVNAMQLEIRTSADDFLLADADLEGWTPAQPAAKRHRDTGRELYKSEHMDIFGMCGMPWPPAVPEGNKVGADGIDYSFMTTRMKEAVFFLHRQFPVPSDRVGKWEAIDLNESLKRLLQWPVADVSKMPSPWRYPQMGTLTSQSKWCVRRITDSGKLTCRLLRGVELMRAVGWDLDDWAHGARCVTSGEVSEDTLRSLAGNAFSGYAFAPVCAAALACLRLPVEASEMCEAPAVGEEVCDRGVGDEASADQVDSDSS